MNGDQVTHQTCTFDQGEHEEEVKGDKVKRAETMTSIALMWNSTQVPYARIQKPEDEALVKDCVTLVPAISNRKTSRRASQHLMPGSSMPAHFISFISSCFPCPICMLPTMLSKETQTLD